MSEHNDLKTRQEVLPGTNEPLFIDVGTVSKVREEFPFVERNAIIAIVAHWSDDTYLGLRWKQVDWETLITGGIEPGQTPEDAARAEIEEETGYRNMRLVKQLTSVHSKFFHNPKNENRFAHFTVLYFQLIDGERNEISEDEQKKHEVVWLTKEEMNAFNLPAAHQYPWNELWSA